MIGVQNSISVSSSEMPPTKMWVMLSLIQIYVWKRVVHARRFFLVCWRKTLPLQLGIVPGALNWALSALPTKLLRNLPFQQRHVPRWLKSTELTHIYTQNYTQVHFGFLFTIFILNFHSCSCFFFPVDTLFQDLKTLLSMIFRSANDVDIIAIPDILFLHQLCNGPISIKMLSKLWQTNTK